MMNELHGKSGIGTAVWVYSFCKQWGSSLPWMDKTGKTVVIPAGTLEQDPEIRPFQNIFCASTAGHEAPGRI
jgi:hypothetical protein